MLRNLDEAETLLKSLRKAQLQIPSISSFLLNLKSHQTFFLFRSLFQLLQLMLPQTPPRYRQPAAPAAPNNSSRLRKILTALSADVAYA